jgi:hypothetical protein
LECPGQRRPGMKLIIFLSIITILDTGMDAYLKLFPVILILGAYVFSVFDIIFFGHVIKGLKKKIQS